MLTPIRDNRSDDVADDADSVTYLGHATSLVEVDGVRLLTDPLLRRRTAHLRRPKFSRKHRNLSDVDAVLISHMHWDHLDIPSLQQLPPGTPIFAPEGAEMVLRRAGINNVVVMREGDERPFRSLQIRATPANHDGNRPPFGPDGEALGFLIRGSTVVYFAGDTDLFDDMEHIGQDLDLALLPVWGWGPSLGEGHLNPERAATALTRLRPTQVVPIHWGTLCPIGLKWTRPLFLTEPPREFAREADRQAPDVDVRILEPGGSLSLIDRAR